MENPTAQSSAPAPVVTNKWLYILVALCMLVFGAVTALAYQNYQLSQKLAQEPVTQLEPTPTADETANWQTYTSTTHGFSVKFPQNFVIKENEFVIEAYLSQTDLENNQYCPKIEGATEPFPCAPPIFELSYEKTANSVYTSTLDYLNKTNMLGDEKIGYIPYAISTNNNIEWAVSPPLGLEGRPSVESYIVDDQYIYHLTIQTWIPSYLKYRQHPSAENNNWNEKSNDEINAMLGQINWEEIGIFTKQILSTFKFADSLTDLERGPAFITSADLLIAESYPVQVSLHFTADLPNPCGLAEVEVGKPDEQNRITVEVFSLSSPDLMCIQAIESIEKNVGIPMEGAADGTYSVWLNDKLVGEFNYPG